MTIIKATVIADSYNNYLDSRVTTFELEYPRLIHSELMTHRVFSRNSASSRAIPVSKVIEMVEQSPAMPMHWGKNQPGMQAKEEINNPEAARLLWIAAAKSAVSHARVMQDMNLHKQVINRILEPYQWMKVVLTSTDFNNWFWLRNHPDADPTIKALAEVMYDEYTTSLPAVLHDGEWHMPYVAQGRTDGKQMFFNEEDNSVLSVEQALKLSSSCCAQVSYRKNDSSLEKAEVIYDKLIKSEPCHASPTEHQCQIITVNSLMYQGTTHIDKSGRVWSGNLRGWVQHRQLIPNNAKYN
jgi:thymidylate synthase ThyX